MKRLYWWARGAPQDRLGGPWWYQDFTTDRERQAFLDDLRPFLYKWAFTDAAEGALEPMSIYPPKSAEIRGDTNE